MPLQGQRPVSRSQVRIHSGFTLVELLTVIVIIAVVASIVAVGIFSVADSQRERSTTTRLESLTTMVTEYRRNTTGSVAAGATATARQLPLALRDPVDDSTPELEPVVPPELADPEFLFDQASADNLVATTQAVIERLLQVPTNRSAYAELPASAKTEAVEVVSTNGLDYADESAAMSPLTPPLMIDGWGQPILYVPDGGLTGLRFTSDPQWDASTSILVAQDGGPYFMSAGADGDFLQADDNVYSKPVVAQY